MSLSADERLAIHELYARYNRYIDSGAVDQWASLFTDDGTFAGTLTVTGAAELRAFAAARWDERNSGPFRDAQHWVSNIVLVPELTIVRGACDLIWLGRNVHSGACAIITMGRFADTLVGSGERWRFAARVFTSAG